MNAYLVSQGMGDTHFENPAGLDGENHVATARDLALLTAKAMNDPVLAPILGTTKTTLPSIVKPEGYTIFTTNNLLVDGVELDDPSRIRNIDPATVDHIEIISGPQASTIYGSGTSSSVMQIFTKHGTADSAKPEVTGKVQLGTIAHKYNPDASPLRKDVGLGVSGGNATAGYTVDGSWEGEGDFEKYRHGEQRNFHGGMRFDQGEEAVFAERR